MVAERWHGDVTRHDDVRAFRTRTGLSQRECAALLGTSVETVRAARLGRLRATYGPRVVFGHPVPMASHQPLSRSSISQYTAMSATRTDDLAILGLISRWSG